MSKLLEIDGSVLEGGGQILRNSISLSAILKVPVRITKIRAGRSKPGLAAQHLKGIELVGEMCGAQIKGARIGSTEVEFIPRTVCGGRYFADTKTAGSIALLLQTALPVALLAGDAVTLDLRGGTNADMAPQIDYIGEVFRYMLNHFGGDFSLEVHKRGYFPKGGGHVTVEVTPVRLLRAADLTRRGNVDRVYGWAFVAGSLNQRWADEMALGACEELEPVVAPAPINIECYKEHPSVAPDTCCGVILGAELSSGCVLGSDALGKRQSRDNPRNVGKQAAQGLKQAILSGGCVDSHTQDQLIIYMALAEGKSSLLAGEITLHTQTAIYIAEIMTKTKFTITPRGEQNVIECVGVGFINSSMQPLESSF